jgi:hypothetical protein
VSENVIVGSLEQETSRFFGGGAAVASGVGAGVGAGGGAGAVAVAVVAAGVKPAAAF